jgi:hypothetical protein
MRARLKEAAEAQRLREKLEGKTMGFSNNFFASFSLCLCASVANALTLS